MRKRSTKSHKEIIITGLSEIKNINLKQLTQLRHELHTIPETAGDENETADKIESFLRATNPDELTTEIGGNGIVAEYAGKSEGPAVMIRCELDGLPIAEDNDFDYKSTNKGNGHKCGHDGHMAILCGLAQRLSRERPEKGKVYLLFQPAEETGQGALWMLDDDKFEKFNPDHIFALHNVPGFERHQIVCRKGVFAAASAGFIAKMKGATSHAAHPEEGNNPALAMAQLVQLLSSFPQFYASLDKAAKVTVVQAHLGEKAFGTSPGDATVMATLRAYDDEVIKQLKQKANTMTEALAETHELKLKKEWTDVFTATLNDAKCVSVIEQAAGNNDLDFLEKEVPFPWSEDFGRFTDKFSGAMFGLGAGKDHPELHASDYDFPDEIIETGVKMFTEIVNIVLKSEN